MREPEQSTAVFLIKKTLVLETCRHALTICIRTMGPSLDKQAVFGFMLTEYGASSPSTQIPVPAAASPPQASRVKTPVGRGARLNEWRCSGMTCYRRRSHLGRTLKAMRVRSRCHRLMFYNIAQYSMRPSPAQQVASYPRCMPPTLDLGRWNSKIQPANPMQPGANLIQMKHDAKMSRDACHEREQANGCVMHEIEDKITTKKMK